MLQKYGAPVPIDEIAVGKDSKKEGQKVVSPINHDVPKQEQPKPEPPKKEDKGS